MSELPDDWTEPQQVLFTKVYKFMTVSMAGIVHPNAPIISPQHWQTICHNAAYTAAELLEHDSLRVVDVDTDETIAESPGSLNS